jgi:hypothetical protein
MAMPNLLKKSCGEHILFLYDTIDARDKATLKYINEALKNSQLVVYASVDADDASYMTKVSSKIIGFKKNINQGNLLIMRLRLFYERVLSGDLEAFKDFKELLEEIVQERTLAGRKNEVLIVADCADNLSRNEKFDECVYVEIWWQSTHLEWQKNGLNITVICPHPRSILEKNPFVQQKQRISRQHSLTVTALTR